MKITDHYTIDDNIPLTWTVEPTSPTVRYKIYDYTKDDSTNVQDPRPYRPDTNYLGEHQDIYLMEITPAIKQNNTDSMVVFIHGGGFRKGDAQNMVGRAIQFAERGYTSLVIEYPRGYIEGDTIPLSQLPPDAVAELFCKADSNAFKWAAFTAIDYVHAAMDYVTSQGVGRYNSTTDALVVTEPDVVVWAASTSLDRHRPTRVMLWGSSAGASIVYYMITQSNAKARWKVIGAAIHAGGISASDDVLYTNTPVLAVHNNMDPKSPFLKGRPYEMTTGCANYPESFGSSYILKAYKQIVDTTIPAFYLVNTCDRGHGYGVYDETYLVDGLMDLLQVRTQIGTHEVVIDASGNNEVVYSIELDGDCP